jgi:hypothetical protein
VGGPGLAFETWVLRQEPTARRNPGLKIETWATHLIFVGAIFEKHFHEGATKPRVPPLRSPRFPVETRGFDDLHAALSTESRRRGRR